MELFFDASGKQDASVVEAVERLFECCLPTEESRGKNKPSPPLVVLHWGKVTSFPAFVTQVSAKYTRFAFDGTPIRATCSLSLEEMPGDPAKQNPTSGGLSARRAHTVTAGDSLASLAYREYGDPTLWRALARYNGIDDPIRLRPGHRAADPEHRRPARPDRLTACPTAASSASRSTASRCRPTSRRCSRPRTWTTACTCPTCSCCASGTPSAWCCPRPHIKIGSTLTISVTGPASTTGRCR